MARARNIKPGLYKNEDLAECSVWARYIFPGMWMLADREGRMEDRPKRIKGELLPYDSVEVEPLLDELSAFGFIVRYSVNGVRYIQICKFSEHQTPHVREQESAIPGPEKEDQAQSTAKAVTKHSLGSAESSPRSPDSLIPSSLIPDSPMYCSEPQSDSEPEVIGIPLNNGKEFPISQKQADEWTAAYPAVDVVRQLAAMRQWCIANPTRRKTSRGVLAFCNAWLMREQDKPAPQARGSPSGYESAKDRSRREAAEQLTGRKQNDQRDFIIDIN